MRIRWLSLLLAVLTLIMCAGVVLADSNLVNSTPDLNLEVHGWSLTRLYVDATVDANRDLTGDISDIHRATFADEERISLSGLMKFKNGSSAYGEIYIHPLLKSSDPSALYLESAYYDVPTDPGSKARVGKGRNMAFGLVPTYGNRKTSNYSPLSEAFTQDRVLGVQYIKSKGPDYFALGLLNMLRPGKRFIGVAAGSQLYRNDGPPGSLGSTTVAHLADRDAPGNRPDTLQASARYARQIGDLNIGVSGRVGELDNQDVGFMASNFPTYGGGKDVTRWGADTVYRKLPYFASAQYYAGDTGGIKNNGWEVTIGVEPSKKCTGFWREFSSACQGLFVRYGQLDIDVPTTLNSITWDTRQLAVSYVLPLKVEGVDVIKWLQFEYESNTEKPPAGADEVPNNLFFVELFTAF